MLRQSRLVYLSRLASVWLGLEFDIDRNKPLVHLSSVKKASFCEEMAFVLCYGVFGVRNDIFPVWKSGAF